MFGIIKQKETLYAIGYNIKSEVRWMANETNKNLIPQSKRTKEKQREIAKKGGIASGEARRAKKSLREAMQVLMDADLTGKDGKTMTGTEAMAAKAFQAALKGDWKAWELVRDTAGQKPIDKVQMKTDINIAESAERLSNIFEQIKDEK